MRTGRKLSEQTKKKISESMKEQYIEEIKLLKKNYSLRNINKITGTSLNTLQKVKKLI